MQGPLILEKIALRPVEEGDTDFLKDLYYSSRQHEMDLLSEWTEEMKDAFITQQFHAQDRYYRENYEKARLQVILYDHQPIGRFYTQKREDEIRIMDVIIKSGYRGAGLGTHLIRSVMEEARQGGLAVRIHVEYNNPALRLYHRLGFEKIGENGIYFLLEWKE
jgi:RimJ/RimL family protein N-acetyltransferase